MINAISTPQDTRTLAPVRLSKQATTILNHLLSGNRLTRYEAILMFRIQNITARISELRKAGYDINVTAKIDPNGQRYAVYSL